MIMILRQLKTSILALAILSILTGLIYPWIIYGVAQMFWARQANGSLILRNGIAVGSELIGQPFDNPKYFWGRPSATDTPYNASNSNGSNLGPLNPDLLAHVQARIDALKKADPKNTELIPVDLVTSSASGLDPHISLAAAYYQAGRVARTRGISIDAVRSLIRSKLQGRFLGILGESVVNVLQLNLALDALTK
jgi:K+-transporting ATPase ATPase C chain